MKLSKTLCAGLLATFAGFNLFGVEIISDNYNVTGSGSGFALGSGVNSGINPPTTRLTGSAAPNLRYIKAAGIKADSAHTITTNTLKVTRVADSSTLSLSSGTGTYDFSSALNSLAASPGQPAVYELRIKFSNAAAGTQRSSFAFSSTPGTAGQWDFGLQLYKAVNTDTTYTLRKRIGAGANGVTALDAPITTLAAAAGSDVSFLIRVTDAGLESSTFSSKIEVSIDGGATWIYDTSTDVELPSGFRFPGTSRYVYFDVAGNAGPVNFDDFSINWLSGPTAGPRTWTGGGSDDNWSTGANWGGVAPSTGDMLIFNGTTRQANVNDLTDLVAPWVRFDNGGFVLSGNPLTVSGAITNAAGNNTFAGDLGFSSTAVKTWNIASGSQITQNNTNNVEVNGEHTLIGGGTLRLNGVMQIGQIGGVANPAFVVNDGQHLIDGGTFISRGGYRIGSSASGSGATTILTNGATLSLTTSGANLRVGDSANPVTSQLLINNSTLTLAGGMLGIPYAANSTGAVVQVGGTVSGGPIAFNDNGAGTGTYSIKNGTLETTQIREDNAAGLSAIYFDNAVLRAPIGANTAFFSGVDIAEIQAGGLILDGQSDVTIAQVLSGAGAFVKSNYSAVTLTGANTYSGNTIVQGGKLVLSTFQTNATTVQVADSTEFGVRLLAPGSSLSVSALNFAAPSFSTLSFDLGAFPSPTAPLVKASAVSVSGPVTINVANGLQLTPGQIVLVDYNTLSGGFQFTLGSLPAGVSATLVHNVANTSIDLNITAVPGYRWTGAVNGEWDNSTQNWLNLATSSASAYSDGAPTEFLDGAATGNINIGVFPSAPVISVSNNLLAYAWTGGGITTPILKKYGTNSLTRVGGDVDLVAGIEINEGSYVFNPSLDMNFSSVLSDTAPGTGAFEKAGFTVLTMAATNTTYDGAVVVKEGTLKLGHSSNALGSTNGPTIVTSGATLDVNDLLAVHEPVIVSGSGVNGQGAIIDSTTGGGVANNLTDVTMVGDTTFGSPNGGRWDIRVRSGTGPGPGLRGNGYNLTKVGSGAVSIACQRNIGVGTPYWEMNLGDVFINEGSLTFAESLSLGNPEKMITIAPGASLGTFENGDTNPIPRTVIINNSAISSGGGVNDITRFTGPVQITGNAEFRPNGTILVFDGPLQGSGATVTVGGNSTGTLLLNGVNTYTGDTYVTNAIFGGTGTIAGNVIMLGGTLTPGSLTVGTLTVNGNFTLGTSTKMELNRSLSPNSDRLVVGGTLTIGGTLTVTLANGAPAPQAGDVYQLFNKAGSGTFTTITLPDLSGYPGGLGWDTSNLYVNGTITVTGQATPPTFGGVTKNGNDLTFSGSGGVEGQSYVVLTSTNIATPLVNWIPVATNVFGVGGSFSYTHTINPAAPLTFFSLQLP